jgi:C4-dicarboxylate-specific signal transduction histidine kinase
VLAMPQDFLSQSNERDGPAAESRRLRFLELLADCAAEMLNATALEPVLDRLFLRIRDVLRLDTFFHYGHQGDDRLELVAHAGLCAVDYAECASIVVGQGVCGSAAQLREAIVLDRLQARVDEMTDFLRKIGMDACACSPLLHSGELLGTLGFCRRGPGFDSDEIQFMQTLSSYVALAKHRIHVDAALRAGLAERDRLIAEQRTMEQKVIELTRVGALGAVAATIAHELNQPLSAAVNYASAIRLAPNPDPARTIELARETEKQLLRAGDIIRRIRRMVSPNGPDLDDVDLRPAAEEAIGLVRGTIGGQLPQMEVVIGDGAAIAYADQVQIVQVLANLLRNAIESTAQAPDPRIAIETHRTDDADIEIRVVDNGVGVSADARAAMFHPRSGQLGNGQGLGLAISRSLVEAHGGSIRVDETPGGGATFAFTVPANS